MPNKLFLPWQWRFYVVLELKTFNIYYVCLILVCKKCVYCFEIQQPWPSYLQDKPWKDDTNNISKCSKTEKEDKTKPGFIGYSEWDQLRKSNIYRHDCFFPINSITLCFLVSWFLSPGIGKTGVFCRFEILVPSQRECMTFLLIWFFFFLQTVNPSLKCSMLYVSQEKWSVF